MATLYVAMREAMLVLSGATDESSWTVDHRFTGHSFECVAATSDSALCGTFDAGVHRSTDGGRTWDRIGRDAIGPDAVMSIASSPHDPAEWWLGTEPSRVYRSTDGGDTWERRPGLTDLPSASTWYFPPRPHTHHVRWIEPDPHKRSTLYVGIEAGALVVTRDGATTWEDRRSGSRLDNHSLATHPDAPGHVWSAAGDGFAESDDGARRWTHPQEGLDHRYCWSVVPDPDDPSTLLLSAASGPRSAHSSPGESYVYRRRSDEAWERLDDRGLPTGEGVLRSVLQADASTGRIYAANNRGVFATETVGDSWERLPVDWPTAFESSTVRGVAFVP